MRAAAKRLAFAGCATVCAFVITTGAEAADVRLPPETATLRPSTLPGHAVAEQKCGVCHSADYVDYQPPNMTLAQWTAEMTKMQKAYGAPITDDEVKLLGVYLAATYGDAKTVSDADRALVPAVAVSVPPAVAGPAREVRALLDANGCLACHAVDRTGVGPGYHDVAVKYGSDPQALAHVAASIRDGGAGRWGTVPMPPFADLAPDNAKTLAAYVLRQ